MRNNIASRPEMAEARAQGLLNIGDAADASGVSQKSIRHYETIGLIPPANRSGSNYRLYSRQDVQTLRFIRHARALGFSLERIRNLLALWQDRNRSSADVKRVALQHIAELDRKIDEMQAMRATLSSLARDCHGDARPDCPILDGFASEQRDADSAHTSRCVE
ncbi:MAG: Cu(I)-responsive transcriptional regulator [Gammaproteobacteria bacterium]